MARFRWVGALALGCSFLAVYSGATSRPQNATSRQPRKDSPLVALLREGYWIQRALDEPERQKIDDYQTTRLFWYIEFTDVRAVRTLLNKGVDVNAADRRSATALLYATGHASHPVIKELLRHGADVNVADRWGETPLMIASAHSDVYLVRLLLQYGAKVNARTKYGRTALAMAHGDPKIVSILLRAGATVDALTLTMATPGLHATPASIGALLDTGINVNARGEDGRTALFGAVAANKVELVRYLLKRGADAHVKDRYGRTILAVASDGGIRPLKTEMVKLLRKAGEAK